jgi:hypothetical protein
MYPNLVPFQVVILNEVKDPCIRLCLSADARYIYFDFALNLTTLLLTEIVHLTLVGEKNIFKKNMRFLPKKRMSSPKTT